MKWWTAATVVGACGLFGCDSEMKEEAAISPEPLPPAPVAPEKPQPKLTFALVHQGTPLHVGPNDSTESFRPLDRLPGGRADGGAVLMAFDGEQPESEAWVRLVATDRRGRCGYQPLASDDPVFVRRSELMRTLTEPMTLKGKGETRIELTPGVALQVEDAPGTFTVTTREVRIAVTLSPESLRHELGEAALEPVEGEPSVAAATSAAPAPSSLAGARAAAVASAGMIGLLHGGPTKLRVGRHEVRLSSRFPPSLTPGDGEDGLSHLDTPCVKVVGKPVRPPSPYGSAWGSDALSARGDMWGDSIGDSFGVGGLGLSGIGEGGGGRGEGIGLGSVGRIGGGIGTGQGYGSGSGRLGVAGKARKPRIRVGTAHTTKGLDGTVVQRILRSRSARMRHCYEQGLERQRTLSGAVMLEFSIQLDGRVASARSVPKSASQPRGTDLADGAVVSCVVAALQGAVFPKPKGDVHVKAKVRLVLSP